MILYDIFMNNVDAAVRYLASDFGKELPEEYWKFAKSVVAERLMLVAESESAEKWVYEITDGEWRKMRTFHDVIDLYQMDMYMLTDEDEDEEMETYMDMEMEMEMTDEDEE